MLGKGPQSNHRAVGNDVGIVLHAVLDKSMPGIVASRFDVQEARGVLVQVMQLHISSTKSEESR
jgi:hypothetical protein